MTVWIEQRPLDRATFVVQGGMTVSRMHGPAQFNPAVVLMQVPMLVFISRYVCLSRNDR